jgi:hypothetical protein
MAIVSIYNNGLKGCISENRVQLGYLLGCIMELVAIWKEPYPINSIAACRILFWIVSGRLVNEGKSIGFVGKGSN